MSVVADGIVGVHPFFAGIEEPVDFAAAESPWKLRQQGAAHFLDWQLGGGRTLSYRLPGAPTVAGDTATVDLGGGHIARWSARTEFLKLEVVFAAKPTATEFAIPTTRTGLTFIADGNGGLDVHDVNRKVGALPRPWLDDADGVRHLLAWETTSSGIKVVLPTLADHLWVGAVLDPTTITTSTASTATAYSNQRKIDRCQNGVLWSMFWDGTSTTGTSMDFYYSTDNGATWTKGGEFGFVGTGTSYVPNASLFIDLDDYAHVVYKDRSDGYIYYRRGTPNAARTSWTWSAAELIATASGPDSPDVVACRDGSGGWDAFITSGDGSGYALYKRIHITSAGVLSQSYDGLPASYGSWGRLHTGSGTAHAYPSIDFHHTGDGKTVAGGTPHLYVAWSAGGTGAGKGIRFRKATYSGGSWTWGTEREIDSTRFIDNELMWLNCLFDGTRIVIAGTLFDGASYDVILHERDAADTTTTSRVLLDNATTGNQRFAGSASYDSEGNVYLVGAHYNGSAYSTSYVKWTRSSGSLGSPVSIDPTTSERPYVSAKRGYSNSRIEFIYTDGTASPYNVVYDSISLGTPVAQTAQVTETGTVKAGSPVVDVAGSPVQEVGTVNAGGFALVRLGVQVTEAGTVHAGRPKVDVGGVLVTETGSVRTGTPVIRIPGGRVTETGTVHTGTVRINEYIEIFRAVARRRWESRLTRRP